MLRAILFDFNGILVDDEPLHLELFQRVLAEEGLSLSREEYWERYLGFDDEGCFSAVLEAAGQAVSRPDLMRLVTRKAQYYKESIRRTGYPFFAGSVELVRSAADAGLALGVVSGALRDEVEGALRQAGLSDRFKLLVTADEVEVSKPDPESYRRGIELLNTLAPLPDRLIHPHEVLAIEDSPAGLESARAVGVHTLGVAHTYPPAALELADSVVDELAGLDLPALYRIAS